MINFPGDIFLRHSYRKQKRKKTREIKRLCGSGGFFISLSLMASTATITARKQQGGCCFFLSFFPGKVSLF